MNALSAQPGDRAPGERDLWGAVENLELPLFLTDLRDFSVVGATSAFFSEVGVAQADVLGKDVFVLFEPPDRTRARAALGALAAGTIDFYRTHRQLAFSDSQVSIWVHVIDRGTRHYALAEVCRSSDLRVSPLVSYLGQRADRLAIGIVNHDGVVTAISSDVSSVTGIGADDLIGRPLLKESGSQLWRRLHAGDAEAGPCTISPSQMTLHLAERAHSVNCLLACLTGTDSYCFILYRVRDEPRSESPDRVAQLEQSLWRIAQEVQASGVFAGMNGVPDVDRFPQLGSLTTRQWEIVTRLLRGERVGTIAKELFVSPSTVRNGLSSVFAKFGVHSQSELLELLQG